MKRSRLPLTALRSFEAAGRHMSFSRAAEELHVSQAAVSRQIRELEGFLRTQLFTRSHRKVELTAPGRTLHRELVASFDAIDRSVSALLGAGAPGVVRVSAEPSLAAAWLLPRLDRFRALHPDIDVALDVDSRLVSFRSHEPTLALRFSVHDRSWPGCDAELLWEAVDTPVVAPALLAAKGPLASPADLAGFTLLHEENRSGWARWFHAAGLEETAFAQRGPLLADAWLSKQAALLGHGVALGDILLVHEELASGELVQPFATVSACGAYFLVARDLAKLNESERAFAGWIRAEIADSLRRMRQNGFG